MAWNLPPGCTDKDVDDAAPQVDMVQCDNCQNFFDPEDDEDSFIGWAGAFGDTAQCGKCRRAVDPRLAKAKHRARVRYQELRHSGLGHDAAADQAGEEHGVDPSDIWHGR